MEIDIKDRKILYELDKNARASFSSIAKSVRLSKNSVINRIKKMEEDQIILGYNTLINLNQLSYTTYDIYIKFKNTSLEKEKQIIDKLIKNKDVWFVGKADGEVNLGLLISTKTPEEFFNIWDEIYNEINNFVKIVRIAILLEYHHFNRKYLLAEEKDQRSQIIIGKRGNLELDPKNRLLLKHISQNARASLLELSQKLKITPKAVLYRIKNLERDKIILGYKINLNFDKLGIQYYKISLKLNDLTIREKIYEFLKLNSNVVYFDKFIGGNDFEFDIELNSKESFNEFIDNLRKNFPTQIESYSYFKPLIIYKSHYF